MFLTFSALSPAFSVYIVGDSIIHIAGSGALLAFLVGGIAAAVLALLYAEVGAAFPGAGGIYPSLAALLGSLTAFPYIILMAPIAIAGTAYSALGFADYIRVLAPGVPLMPIALGSLLLGTGIAVLNVRAGALVTGIFLAIETIAVVILSGVALFHPVRSFGAVIAQPVMLQHGALVAVPFATLGLAVVSGVYACGGGSWAMYFAEEMRDARRQIGRVIAWTGAIASVAIAAPVILMLMSARDLSGVLSSETPMATFLKETGGPMISAAVSAGVAAAVFNALVAAVMAYSRYVYATGRDGIWPGPVNRVLAALHPGFRTPVAATLILVAAAGAACFLGENALLILISGNVSDYILISIAIFVGRRRRVVGRDFRAPLHPMVPIFGLTVAAFSIVADWMDQDAGRPSMILLVGLFFGALAYYHFRLRQVSRTWQVGGAALEVPELAE
jgi:amino acid transporter